jgi:16S rRNA (cytidine1402-2'-O)-methyltransferase
MILKSLFMLSQAPQVITFLSQTISAVVAALSVSGFSANKFSFEGFLPRKGLRKKYLENLSTLNDKTIICKVSPITKLLVFESPLRILDCLQDCLEVFGDNREAVIVRELTKIHEQVVRGTFSHLLTQVATKQKGEFVVVISPLNPSEEVET